ncbi:hypothetical protein [Streptomyces sp. NPDC048489]|uniref:hypothetical protein n=1 Tax=Streptomyces sp. NPDC048489 TaxID=3154504 RepID=UPI00344529B5
MDTHEEAARGLADIEDFLRRESRLGAAHRRAADLTARVPGLTRRQRADIEEWYVEEQRHVARLVTEHIADTVGEVERRHRARFGRWLRGTLAAMALITAVMALVSVVLVVGASA